MGAYGASFNNQIFRKDYPMVFATNRQNAVMLPVQLAYDSGGYLTGQILALNTTSTLYQKYNSGGSSGTNTAACVLFDPHGTDDFPSTTGTCFAAAIFGGGCTLFKTVLVAGGYTGTVATQLGMTEITDATGVTVVKY
jgi:hypothetical protein